MNIFIFIQKTWTLNKSLRLRNAVGMTLHDLTFHDISCHNMEFLNIIRDISFHKLDYTVFAVLFGSRHGISWDHIL